MAYDSGKKSSEQTKTPNTAFEASNEQGVYFIEEPEYTEKEGQYRQWLLKLMEKDRNRKESPHLEYNGLTYNQNYRANMLSANSYTPPRVNAEDTQVVTGTTREKVLAIVSAVLTLNFKTMFRSFNQDDEEDEELGQSMSDCVERANKIEMWDDKKLYAYFEMAVQGDCYVQKMWVDETVTDKKKIKLSDIDEKLMKTYKADYKIKVTSSGVQSNLIPGTQVYKGSMTERDLSKQPHIFTREIRPYELVKSVYGNLPRFKNVPRRLVTVGPSYANDFPYGQNWRLESTEDETCEIIKYTDPWNDEYQLFINGVMMLPVGFPTPWEYQGYDLVQGRLEPISAFFSESKSIPTKTKLDQEILDEMYRLAVLKTQKSFMPPIANYSTNILTRSAFLPGVVNNNMQKGELEVLGGDPSAYSMKPSEFEMIKMVKQFIDEKSVSPALQGQAGQGDQTATQNNNIMQQAKQSLGVLIFGFIQFHMNLDTLCLYTLLDNMSKPVDTKLNKSKDGITNKFRSMSISKEISGKGMGVKQIQFTDDHNTPSELWDMENGVTRDENGKPTSVMTPKKPMQISQISPTALRSIKYSWYAETIPVERETSISERIAFEDRLKFAMEVFGQQSINIDNAETQWAIKNKINPDTFFNKNQQPQGQPEMAGAGGSIPQESNMQKQMRPFSSGAGPAEAMRQGVNK